MKKLLAIALFIISAALLFTSCGSKGGDEPSTGETASAESSSFAESSSVAEEDSSVVYYDPPAFDYFKTVAEIEATYPDVSKYKVVTEEPASGGTMDTYYDGDVKKAEYAYDDDGNLFATAFFEETGQTVNYTTFYTENQGYKQINLITVVDGNQYAYAYTFYDDDTLAAVSKTDYDSEGNMIAMDVYAFDEQGRCIGHQNLADIQSYLMGALSDRLAEELTPEKLVELLGG